MPGPLDGKRIRRVQFEELLDGRLIGMLPQPQWQRWLSVLKTAVMLLRTLALVCLFSSFACTKSGAQSQPEASTTASRGGADVAQAPSAEHAQTPTIVFLGDSLTAGRGLDTAEALPALLQAKVDEAGLGYKVINAGRSGDTTAGGLARLAWYLRDGVNPRVLVIGLGSNDAMRGLELAAVEDNLRRIIDQARQFRPALEILLWELQTFPNLGPDYGGDFKSMFGRVAKEKHVTLIPFPLNGVAGTPHLNQSDGVHPNAEGSRIVADNVWRVLRPVL